MSQLKIDKSALSAVEGQLKASRSDIVNSLTNIIKVSNSLAATNIFSSPIYMAGVREDDEPIKDYRDEARSYIKYAKKINSYAKDILNVQEDLTDVIEKINSILNAVDEFEGQSMSLDNIVPKSMEITNTGLAMGTGLGFANVTEEEIKIDNLAMNNRDTLNNEEIGITKVDNIFNKENIIDTNGKVSENVASNWNNLDGANEVNLEEVGVDVKPSMSLFSMNKEEGLGGTLALSLGTGVAGGITPLIDTNDDSDDKLFDKKKDNKDDVTSKTENNLYKEETPVIAEDSEEINITSDEDKTEDIVILNTEYSEEIDEEVTDSELDGSTDIQNTKLQEDMNQENNGIDLEKETVKYTDEDNSDDISKDTGVSKDIENKENNKIGLLVTDVIDLAVDDTVNDDSKMEPMSIVKEVPEAITPAISNVSLGQENTNPFSGLDTNDIKNSYNNTLNYNENGQNINNISNNVNNSVMFNNINGNIDSRVDNVAVKYEGENKGLNANIKYAEKPGLGELILIILMMIVIVVLASILKYLNYINYIAFGLFLIANALLFFSYLSIRSKKMKAYKMYINNVNMGNVNNIEHNKASQQLMFNNGYNKTFGNGNLGQNNTLVMNEVEIMQQNQLNGNRR